MRVLAGDIGGSHTRLAVCRVDGGERPEILELREYESASFDGPGPAVLRFLEETGAAVEGGCLAVPCPVEDGRCEVTNLDWTLDAAELRAEVGTDDLFLINDFDAVGSGIGSLRNEDRAVLKDGEARDDGPVAYLGPGTGFGHGFLTREGGEVRVHGSEGGHVDFAPRSELEWRLRGHLAERHGRVSYERVVSGPGLVEVYDFLIEDGHAARNPELARRREEEDPAALVSEYATRHDDPVARTALEIFISALGAQAGNLALTIRATGGVYLAGGIVPRILDEVRRGPFEEAFLDKGRMTDLLADVPVWAILDDEIGIVGAATAGARAKRESEKGSMRQAEA